LDDNATARPQLEMDYEILTIQDLIQDLSV